MALPTKLRMQIRFREKASTISNRSETYLKRRRNPHPKGEVHVISFCSKIQAQISCSRSSRQSKSPWRESMDTTHRVRPHKGIQRTRNRDDRPPKILSRAVMDVIIVSAVPCPKRNPHAQVRLLPPKKGSLNKHQRLPKCQMPA